MRKFYFMSMLLAILLVPVLSSCSSDDDDNGKGDYTEYPYSSLTPEQQKEKLAADANTFITKVDGLSTSKGVKLISSLNDLPDLPDFTTSSASDKKVKDSSIEKIIEINEFHGTYTWNFTTEDWDKTEATDKLTLLLPASEASRLANKNDGKIEVTGVASEATTDNGYRLPKELKALLFVDNANVGTINVSATEVSADNYPKSANVSITLEDYTISMSAEKGSNNKTSFSFKKGNESLLEGTANLNGNLEEDKDYGESAAEVKIMDNLLVAHKGDLGKVFSEYEKIDVKYDDVDWTETIDKAYYEEKVAAWNNNMTSSLVSRKDETKIADMILMLYVEKEGQYTYYDQVPAFKFNDDTIVDMEVYFGKGFDNVLSNWEDFINKFF